MDYYFMHSIIGIAVYGDNWRKFFVIPSAALRAGFVSFAGQHLFLGLLAHHSKKFRFGK